MPPPGAQAWKFFISYRREDEEFARHLHGRFLYRGYDEQNVFLDTESIPPGDLWMERIARSIKACDAMVVIIGKTWLGQQKEQAIEEWDNVRAEIALALTDRKLVVPVCIDGEPLPDRNKLHYRIRDLVNGEWFQVSSAPKHTAEDLVLEIEGQLVKRGGLGRDAQQLDEQSPAAGLALGYFVNFVRPAVRQVTALIEDVDRFRYDIEVVDRGEPPATVFRFGCEKAPRVDLRLHIVIPPQLALLKPEHLGPVKRNLHQARILTGNLSRPFLVDAWKPGDAGFQLIDFPNTLTAVEDWLQRRLPLELREKNPEEWRRLEVEELTSFATMLNWWIEGPQNEPGFRQRVEVRELNRGQDSFAWLEAAWRSAVR